jgi:hypothetical protein
LDDPEGLYRNVPSKPTPVTMSLTPAEKQEENHYVHLSVQDVPESTTYNISFEEAPAQIEKKSVVQPILKKVNVVKKQRPDNSQTPKLESWPSAKRPIQSVSGVRVLFENQPAKIAKIVSNPPIILNKSLITIESCSATTQTDEEPEPEPAVQGSTKFLALFECTAENVAKLQRKLEATNGKLLDLDQDFLQTSDGKFAD